MSALNPTVYLVDADAEHRTALAAVIRRAGWMPETFGTAEEFLGRPPFPAPSCLLLDLVLPGPVSLELLRRIASDRTQTPVVVMSPQADVPLTVRAMRAGAVEVLPKPVPEEQGMAAIQEALGRSETVLQREAELLTLRTRYESLSGREREVLGLVVNGRLNKQVGALLGISEITVKAHRGRLMRKMAADSLAALVAMALKLQLPALSARSFGADTRPCQGFLKANPPGFFPGRFRPSGLPTCRSA